MNRKNILAIAAIGMAGLIAFIHSRPDHFRYERSAVIESPAEAIFPYISDLKLGVEWSPYERKDPNMKRTFSGPVVGVGQIEAFDGNSEAGSGQLEVVNLVPNQSVQIRLTMTQPMPADNQVEYTLSPEGTGTRLSWAMSGKIPFFGKIINLLIDCEKMVTADFDIGIQNLKKLVESKITAK